ncbi:adenylate/guanylate cyclase domain-containing protein [Aerosakkonema funiforme]|uniref:adenylate/guanylate cyclase domain-containing protein n=1 Tax=Aerosakkonema funiforme TaxID=1246630 RepID=UPI0035BA1611
MKFRLLPYIAGISAAALMIAGVWIVDRSEQQRFLLSDRADVLNQLSTVQAKLQGGLTSRIFLERGLVAYVSIDPEIALGEFERLGRAIAAQQTGIRSIALYKNTALSHIYPFKGQEGKIGFKPTSIPEHRQAIDRAIKTRNTVVIGPYDLPASGCKIGNSPHAPCPIPPSQVFVTYTPIFVTPTQETPQRSSYWGLASTIIDRDTLFEEARLLDRASSEKSALSDSRLQFALLSQNKFSSSRSVFFGDPTIFQKNPVILKVQLPNSSWQLAAIPEKGWQTQASMSWALRASGTVLALVTGILVFTWVRSPEKLRQAVEKATTALRQSETKYREQGNLTEILAIGNEINEIKAIQAKLAQSEHKFRTLYESTIDAVMLLEGNAFFDCNRATLEMFGCVEKAQFCGKQPSNFSPPLQPDGSNSAALAAQRIATAFREGSCRFEWLHSRLDGSVFPAEVWLTAVDFGFDRSNENPKSRRVLQAVVRDISDRKAREEALRTSQEMLARVMDNIPQAVFWKDRNSVYLGCNHKLVTDLGLASTDDIVGKTDYDLSATKEQADSFYEVDRQIIAADIPAYHISETLRLANGQTAWIDTSKVPLHDAQGNVVGILGTYEDVTDRKRTEEALRESENKFRLLFEKSADAILLLDGDVFIDCNQAAVAMLRAKSKEELLNLHPSQLSPEIQPDGRSSFEKANENNTAALANGCLRFEWVHRRADGTDFPVEVLLTAIPLDGKQILYVVWRDITERKWAEETLRASERRLRRHSIALLDLATRKTIATGDLNAAVREITEVATDILEVERASVWLFNEERSVIQCLDLYKRSAGDRSSGLELKAVDFPAYFYALQAERIIAAHDAHTDPRTSEFSATYLTPWGINSILNAPIRVGGKMVGVICHEHIGPARQWALEEEHFAGSLANFIALAMEAASRKQAQEALQKANEELEMRVDERTAVLKETNRQLLVEILERKRSEEALRVSEEKFSLIFHSCPDMISISTLEEGRLIEVNESFLINSGFVREEVIGRTATELGIWVNPQDRDRIRQMLAQNGFVRNQECAFRSKSASIIVGLLSAEKIHLNGEPCLLVVTTDITYRVRMEEALRYQQQQTERLLLNILPAAIADRLKLEETTIADSFEESTVLFADIVGFTELSAVRDPVALVELLNKIFSSFDSLTDRHGLEKIKTIGDAYMVVGGLPMPRRDHAEAVAELALDMQMQINIFNAETRQNLQLRVGINTGPVVAGVIGTKKFIYDLWGDTVNTASRMESHGIPGQIQVTASTYTLLRDKYLFEERGPIPIKGKGEMTTYFLIGRKDCGLSI